MGFQQLACLGVVRVAVIEPGQENPVTAQLKCCGIERVGQLTPVEIVSAFDFSRTSTWASFFERLMTDNHFSYTKSRSLAELLDRRAISHLKIRPYTPRTNGRVERFHQTFDAGVGLRAAIRLDPRSPTGRAAPLALLLSSRSLIGTTDTYNLRSISRKPNCPWQE